VIIGIVGTRRRDGFLDYCIVKGAFLKVFKKDDTICSGLCPKGADRFAVYLAKKFKTTQL